VFFALSGYLITSLFLAEFSRTNHFDRAAFYARRAVRLVPALAIVAAVGFTVMHVTGFNDSKRSFLSIVLIVFGFLGNWFAQHNGLGILSHTWSLAIEEQFYLVWPVVLLFLLRRNRSRRSIVRGLVIIATIVFTVRLLLVTHGQLALGLYSTYARTDGILLGCALAIALWPEHNVVRQWLAIPAVGAFAAFGLLAFVGYCGHGGMTVSMCTAPGGSILGTVLIGHLVVAPAGAIASFLSVRPLRAIGKISYSLYLIHIPIMILVFKSLPRSNFEAPLFAAGSFAAATVTYLAIERPLIRLHRKRRARKRTPDAAVRPAQRTLVAA
jgi:peptidoglycan/LPS O-acetylase OafA/YrhL